MLSFTLVGPPEDVCNQGEGRKRLNSYLLHTERAGSVSLPKRRTKILYYSTMQRFVLFEKSSLTGTNLLDHLD